MCATNERNQKVESKITGLFPLFLTVLLAYMGQMILNQFWLRYRAKSG